jgi:hypothetical protein
MNPIKSNQIKSNQIKAMQSAKCKVQSDSKCQVNGKDEDAIKDADGF